MKIIISPAKKMQISNDDFQYQNLPLYLDQTETIMNYLKNQNKDELKKIWKCNNKIVDLNYQRLKSMSLTENLSPAILSYVGLQYQHMAPHIFSTQALQYIQEHLCILSAFYGVLKPFDGITPYRLEMQAKVAINDTHSLYDYWAHQLYLACLDDDHIIINLASKEYSKAISNYLQDKDQMVDIIFAERIDGKLKVKATPAKIARGEMVRYMAENQINDLQSLKQFNDGYYFSDTDSNEYTYVFIKK